MPGSVIVGGARTPIGKLLGALSGFAAVDLGAIAIKAALQRAGISGDQVDYVIMGQVLQAGQGQIPSRQASVKAGIPMSVPSLTINKVCLSGLDAIALADQLITAGEFDVVVAGGMESMTNAPHVLPKARHGYKYGSIEVLDATAHDALTDAFDHVSMGLSTERYNARHAFDSGCGEIALIISSGCSAHHFRGGSILIRGKMNPSGAASTSPFAIASKSSKSYSPSPSHHWRGL